MADFNSSVEMPSIPGAFFERRLPRAEITSSSLISASRGLWSTFGDVLVFEESLGLGQLKTFGVG
jgi:hypothetical protein